MINAQQATQKDPRMRVRLDLDADLVAEYEARALAAGVEEVEDYIARHLEITKSRGEADAIYVSGVEAQALRRMLGSQVGKKKSLVEAVKNLVSAQAGGWRVEFPPSVHEQIQWYAHSLGRPVDEVAQWLILEAVREKLQV